MDRWEHDFFHEDKQGPREEWEKQRVSWNGEFLYLWSPLGVDSLKSGHFTLGTSQNVLIRGGGLISGGRFVLYSGLPLIWDLPVRVP